MNATRRQFLAAGVGSAGVVCLGAEPPQFLLQAAEKAPVPGGETVLVVVQLTGGNDGLNTVVPHGDPAYRQARPELAIAANRVLTIQSGLGFHPSLKGFAKLLEQGKLAVAQGIGYAQPNRSHFESMDIWHTCHTKAASRKTGWLGRFLDATRTAGGDLPALHLGHEPQPLALKTQGVQVPSVQSLEKFRLQFEGDSGAQSVASTVAAQAGGTGEGLAGFLRQSKAAAITSSQRVEQALGSYRTQATYPQTDLAEKLRTIAQLIEAGLGARIYYVALDGFDTHSNQPDVHARLLSEWSDGITAFLSDVSDHGHGPRVMVASFSEFGRRVKENASQGTDHGAAAPMILAGERVKPGLHGRHPSLTDLDDGDLKFHTDFRRVYATLLQKWLGHDPSTILGSGHAPLDLLNV